MFREIRHINDLKPFVEHKPEIRFLERPNQTTIVCYLFSDNHTFDSPETLECRGVAFGRDGAIISRPLHKFFNLGERENLQFRHLCDLKEDIAAIYDKLDGSMVATAWFDDTLHFRSKKTFNSRIVYLAWEHVSRNRNIRDFCTEVAVRNMTAIFELTHPDARIVVEYERPDMRLLHVRDNTTGEYVLLKSDHFIHELIAKHRVPLVGKLTDTSLDDLLFSLKNMTNAEGYVVQFKNGDMFKVKCPWYVRAHRCLAYLRERDVALLALNEELDDVKGVLANIGVDLTGVHEVEATLKNILCGCMSEIEGIYDADKTLDRKAFALKHQKHPLFALLMQRYLGQEVCLKEWYVRNRLKQDFGLRKLTNDDVVEDGE